MMPNNEHTPPTEAELDGWRGVAASRFRFGEKHGLGAAEEQRTLRLIAEVRRLRAQAVAFSEYAQHLEWCRACAEDGVSECAEGAALRDITRQEPA